MYRYKKSQTKIIATIGPACDNKETLRKMILEGVDVFRLNFSHGEHETHKAVIDRIKEVNEELGTNTAILADLQGPKLRIGEVENNGVWLEDGKEFIFTSEKCVGTAEKAYMSYELLPQDVMPGEIVLVDDGKIKLEVVSTNRKDKVVTKVVNGGTLMSKKGVNLPNTKVSLPSLTKKDIKDANYVLEQDIDWIALSFVRSVTDIIDLKELIKAKKKSTKVVAKIEKPEALEEIDNIIDMTDAIMVARGDLGVEVPFDKVPVLQKDLVHKCIARATPVIIATQMMESMITNFRPTRAEATDVANAVVDGADTLMLSGETSVGKFPVEVIKSMQEVIIATENSGYKMKHINTPDPSIPSYLPEAVAYNACEMANLTKAKGIVVFTYVGDTAYMVASHRPKSKIFAFTPTKRSMSQLSLVWGIQSFYLRPEVSINDAIEHAVKELKDNRLVISGDVLVFVGSIPMRDRGKTNMMKISVVE